MLLTIATLVPMGVLTWLTVSATKVNLGALQSVREHRWVEVSDV